MRLLTLFAGIPAILFAFTLTGEESDTPPVERPVEELYDKRVEMIPTRDGVRLYTEIYTPRKQDGELPILLLRTPYGIADAEGGFSSYMKISFRELAKEGYLIAVQDARGRFGSEGKFEWNRPVRHRQNPDAVDASTDAYDTIDWLVYNLPNNNGRVGMLGVSYPGWYVTMALIDPHPALKAASPQASPSDYFIGDDFYHFGAFRLGPSAELPYLFDFDPKENSRFPYDQIDTYEFFLDMGPLANMDKLYLKGASPTWDNFLSHATYDEFWRAGGTLQHIDSITVPTLNVVGWWDAENLGGALDLYDALEKVDTQDLNRIVVGPWAHGQWCRGPNDRLGAYEFGADLVAYYQQQVEAPFFAHNLKGQPTKPPPEAHMFQTGANVWQDYQQWPPKLEQGPTPLYLASDGRLQFEVQPPDTKPGFAQYTSDPSRPVPFTARPIMGFWTGLKGSKDPRFDRSGKLWKVEDQRFVSDRPDVLCFVTEPLQQDLEVVGKITARLFASTSGTDVDWVVKLIDVYPEQYEVKPEMGGYQLMIADEVLRGKFRNGLESPQPITSGEVTEFTIDLRTRNHMFRQGHRVMVQVQSTWFPLIDRNPQKFVDIPSAAAADYQPAEQRVYFTPEFPSRIELPVLKH